MKRVYALATAILVTPFILKAQDANDALRYSNTTFGGTARFMAMGGAFSAVGGDMSTLTYNPAGIGVFTKSQLTISPGFSFQNTTSNYEGMTNIANQASGNIQNAGIIFAWKNTHEEAMWKGIAFGFVYNRTNNFNTQSYMQGNNPNSTLLDAYTDAANGTNYTRLDQFHTGPAFQTGLLDTNTGGSTYFNIIRPYFGNGSNYVTQIKSVSTLGSMGETDLSFGGNYNNKLYIGATLGIPDIRYDENATYSETPSYRDSAFGLNGYSINTNNVTSGSGVNFKIGFIYRPNEWIRLGLAVQTPTVFSLSEENTTSFAASYSPSPYSGTTGGTMPAQYDSSFGYTLITPMRVNGGLAFVIHKQAILSADYEYVDYSTASLSGVNSYSAANQAIASSYMGTSNIRLGGELVLYPFSIRAGYAYYGNPYAKIAENTALKRSISGGVGVRIRHCFIDLAYVYSYYNENYFLYTSSFGNAVAQTNTTLSDVVLSVGVNF